MYKSCQLPLIPDCWSTTDDLLEEKSKFFDGDHYPSLELSVGPWLHWIVTLNEIAWCHQDQAMWMVLIDIIACDCQPDIWMKVVIITTRKNLFKWSAQSITGHDSEVRQHSKVRSYGVHGCWWGRTVQIYLCFTLNYFFCCCGELGDTTSTPVSSPLLCHLPNSMGLAVKILHRRGTLLAKPKKDRKRKVFIVATEASTEMMAKLATVFVMTVENTEARRKRIHGWFLCY